MTLSAVWDPIMLSGEPQVSGDNISANSEWKGTSWEKHLAVIWNSKVTSTSSDGTTTLTNPVGSTGQLADTYGWSGVYLVDKDTEYSITAGDYARRVVRVYPQFTTSYDDWSVRKVYDSGPHYSGDTVTINVPAGDLLLIRRTSNDDSDFNYNNLINKFRNETWTYRDFDSRSRSESYASA